MLRGTLLAESLRLGHDLRVAELVVTRVGRHDVSGTTAPGADGASEPRGAVGEQPKVWTFVDFEAPDGRADELAAALAGALSAETGWYADFRVGDDHVVVFTDRVFRYRIGDHAGRDAAVRYGISAGTPAHQLDWGP
jgi:hypothetical protein